MKLYEPLNNGVVMFTRIANWLSVRGASKSGFRRLAHSENNLQSRPYGGMLVKSEVLDTYPENEVLHPNVLHVVLA
jgi:hypothetical protein